MRCWVRNAWGRVLADLVEGLGVDPARGRQRIAQRADPAERGLHVDDRPRADVAGAAVVDAIGGDQAAHRQCAPSSPSPKRKVAVPLSSVSTTNSTCKGVALQQVALWKPGVDTIAECDRRQCRPRILYGHGGSRLLPCRGIVVRDAERDAGPLELRAIGDVRRHDGRDQFLGMPVIPLSASTILPRATLRLLMGVGPLAWMIVVERQSGNVSASSSAQVISMIGVPSQRVRAGDHRTSVGRRNGAKDRRPPRARDRTELLLLISSRVAHRLARCPGRH